MLNVIDLEARWLRYKIKSYLPHLALFITFVLIGLVLYFYIATVQKVEIEVLNTEELQTPTTQTDTIQVVVPEEHIETKTIVEDNKSQEAPSPLQKEEIIEQKTEEKVETQSIERNIPATSTSRVFTPSMGFMQELKEQSTPYYENANFSQTAAPSSVQIEETFEEEHVEEVLIDSDEEYVEAEETQKYEQIQSKKINIKRQNIEEDLVGIIARFKKSNNPALSLFIAKIYYELGEYHNAYNYALITNDLNRDIETSWLIFSKSLVKLGKKAMAIKTLKEYISYSKSQSAKILLDEIESGKFK